MSYTEKDLEAQVAQFQQIKADFAQMESFEKAFMEKNNFTDADKAIDFNNLTKEEQNIVAYVKAQAEKESGKAKVSAATESKISRRKNMIAG